VGLWFVRSPEPIVAPPGDEVVFECSLNVPAEQVRWRHNGRFLHHHGNDTSGHNPKSNRLVVEVHGEQQAGDYQCEAWFGASALASVPAKLTLAELHQFEVRQNQHYQVASGNTVALHCGTPRSNPPASLQYFKNGRKLAVPAAVELLASTGTLVLQNVTTQDSGSYHCAATNYITGQTVTSMFKITLKVTPFSSAPAQAAEFLFPADPHTNYTVQAGWNVTLECSAVGNPPPKVTWQKTGGAIPANRTHLHPGGLHISHVVKQDEGSYVCEMYNNVGQPVTHTAHLYVQEPAEMLREPKTLVVKEGGDVQLDCLVKGSPRPTISWLLNGEPIRNDTHVQISGLNLTLTHVEKRHAGIYQCFASNELATVYGSAMLQVSPKQVTAQPNSDLLPSTDETQDPQETGVNFGTPAPTRGHGRKDNTRKGKGRRKDKKHKGTAVMIPPSRPNITRLTDSSVMVRWSVPPNNGLPIQFFKVQHRELSRGGSTRRRGGGGGQGKGSRWKTSNEDIPPHIRSYEVVGLETDHTYRFRIAAVYSNNDNKLGANSARFHLHRGSSHNRNPLPPPLLISTQAVNATAIQLDWQYTSPTRVDGFYVYYRETSSAGDYIKATVEGESQRSFVITHLQPDTPYDIKLQSFTVGAASDFSIILTHKTQRVETESLEPEVVAPNVSVGETSNNQQLYLVLGAVIGGLFLLVVLFITSFISKICMRRACAEHQDKFTDPESYSKNILNGSVSQNGFLQNNKMNITNNPLATQTRIRTRM
ncbi:hypothetical protein L9F63_012505, partial [Diploptera punctata]